MNEVTGTIQVILPMTLSGDLELRFETDAPDQRQGTPFS